jgi:thiosulfate/3-mercaptopyruvate sulfurtransferase
MPEFTMLITVSELDAVLADANTRVLDCRFDIAAPASGRRAYLEGHIPGAVFADLDRDLAAPVRDHTGRHPLPTPAAFAAMLGRAGIGNDSQVVVYDAANGVLAARAWWMLRWIGHARTSLLDGGIAAWTAAGHGLEAGDVTATPATFVPRVREGRIVTTAELEAAVAAGDPFTLVDARDEARYAGVREPIDAVAGHIPGAVNFPLGRSLRPDGRWQSPDELAGAWRPVLGDAPGRPWMVMCGSGVTACHLALSGLLAGYREPRVYVGSWSEWIREPRRPVAVGPEPGRAEQAST